LLEVTPAIAECWGRLQAVRPLPAVDALLAASVLTHDLTLVTRNEADFAGLGIHVLNPFQISV
jgi:predicted nucleic acid-binding protein